ARCEAWHTMAPYTLCEPARLTADAERLLHPTDARSFGTGVLIRRGTTTHHGRTCAVFGIGVETCGPRLLIGHRSWATQLRQCDTVAGGRRQHRHSDDRKQKAMAHENPSHNKTERAGSIGAAPGGDQGS